MGTMGSQTIWMEAMSKTISFLDWGTDVNPRDRYRCRIEDGHGLGIAQEDYTQHD